MRITILLATCPYIRELGLSSAKYAEKVFGKPVLSAGTRSFTQRKSPTSVTFVEKLSTDHLRWTLIFAYTPATSHLSATFVAKDFTKKGIIKIIALRTPARSRLNATFAARRSIKCTIWHFICTRTTTKNHSHVKNVAKDSVGILTLKSISGNYTRTKRNVTELNNKARLVDCLLPNDKLKRQAHLCFMS